MYVLLLTVLLAFYLPLAASQPLRFCIVSVTSLDEAYLADEDSRMSLQYAIQSQSAFAQLNDYPFFVATQPVAGSEKFDKRLDWSRLQMTQRAVRLKVCDWVVAMEGDVFITNFNYQLSTIVAAAEQVHGAAPNMILNRDHFNNISTNTAQRTVHIVIDTSFTQTRAFTSYAPTRLAKSCLR